MIFKALLYEKHIGLTKRTPVSWEQCCIHNAMSIINLSVKWPLKRDSSAFLQCEADWINTYPFNNCTFSTCILLNCKKLVIHSLILYEYSPTSVDFFSVGVNCGCSLSHWAHECLHQVGISLNNVPVACSDHGGKLYKNEAEWVLDKCF